MAAVCVLLAAAAAALAHLAVRHAQGPKQLGLLASAIVALCLSFYWGSALGGFWPGVYTLLSVFFLAACLTPWIELLVTQRRVE